MDQSNFSVMDVAGLGIVVRAARIAQGLTRDDLVNVTGLSPKFITHVEAGKPTAQIGKIFILLSELGISLHVQTPVPISPKVAEQARRTRRSPHAR